MDHLRVALAFLALAVPSVLFALNAYVSYRERGIVEPFDIPAAIAFLAYWIVALVLIVGALPLVRRPPTT
jgi:hypothetical protein